MNSNHDHQRQRNTPQLQNRTVGNEVRRGLSQVIDLRHYPAQLPSAAMPEPQDKPAATAETNSQAAAIPQPSAVKLSASNLYLGGLAYDMLLLTVLTIVAATTNYRDLAFLGYLIIVLVFQIASRRIFLLALITLTSIPLLLAFHKTALADTYAIFAFYFMAIGLIRAVIELIAEQRTARKIPNSK